MIRVGMDLHSITHSKKTGVLTAIFLTASLIVLSACDSTAGNTTGTSSGNVADNAANHSPVTTSAPPTEAPSGNVPDNTETNSPTATSVPPTATSEPLNDSSKGTKPFQNIARIPETSKPYTYFVNTVDNEDILPDVSTTPILWWEGLEAMGESQLRLLRNEIYARHGYVFQSKELNDYFSQKSWYRPDPLIREIKLSETEQATLDLIKSYENRKPFALTGGTIISWDLDGNGTKELIQFEAPGYDEYTLHVNNESIAARGDNLMGYCSVIDIDTSDSQCEILVRSLGPSSDDSFHLYRYKNGRIKAIGDVDGMLSDVPGNGYCAVRIRASILQTWFLLDLYRLNEDGMLADVEQKVYPLSAEIKMVNGKGVLEETPFTFTGWLKDVQDGFDPYEYNVVTMLKDLPVVVAPSDLQLAGVLKKGERVVFLGSDNSQWVKIQGESGIIGWFQLSNFNVLSLDGNEYRVDEFFSYLCNAD